MAGEHDNQKLRGWIEAPAHERVGLRLVHLHLSRIDPPTVIDRDDVIRRLMELSREEAQLRVSHPRRAPTIEIGGREQILVNLKPATPLLLRRFQILHLSNGDITVVYKDLAWSVVDGVCRQIEDRIRSKGGTIAANPYDAAGGAPSIRSSSLHSILEFSACLPIIARYLDEIDARVGERDD